MSLNVRPCGQSQVTSGSSAGVTAGQLIASIQSLPPGWYLITGSTGSSTAGTLLQANLGLVVGTRNTPLGLLATPPLANIPFEFYTWIQGNTDVRIFAIAADPANTYVVGNLVVTPVEGPIEAQRG